jgi:hypothetical protein
MTAVPAGWSLLIETPTAGTSTTYTWSGVYAKRCAAADIGASISGWTKALSTGSFCGQIIAVRTVRGYPRLVSTAAIATAPASDGFLGAPYSGTPPPQPRVFGVHIVSQDAQAAISSGALDMKSLDPRWIKRTPGPAVNGKLSVFTRESSSLEPMGTSGFQSTGITNYAFNIAYTDALAAFVVDAP